MEWKRQTVRRNPSYAVWAVSEVKDGFEGSGLLRLLIVIVGCMLALRDMFQHLDIG
ncbi:hypothetical protein [Sphingobacterium sp. SYP-B4668]|uniref:hypothetical protein n=1 Tax=Sphingobacterium sp. SYP-B4668 TaxID=2996035 RepID=UPI0022DD3AB7|nr:hypothetical protein [Sphingobacterium sp. SYP-B4668]